MEIVLVGQVLHKGTDSKVPCRIFIADTRIDQSVGRLRHDIGIRWQEIHATLMVYCALQGHNTAVRDVDAVGR